MKKTNLILAILLILLGVLYIRPYYQIKKNYLSRTYGDLMNLRTILNNLHSDLEQVDTGNTDYSYTSIPPLHDISINLDSMNSIFGINARVSFRGHYEFFYRELKKEDLNHKKLMLYIEKYEQHLEELLRSLSKNNEIVYIDQGIQYLNYNLYLSKKKIREKFEIFFSEIEKIPY